MKMKAIILAVALLGLSLAAAAQTSRGTVSGTVTDSAGAVVPGATITLTSSETNLSRTTTTNDEGFYRFDAVDLGTYSVGIAAANFGQVTNNNVIVNANQTSTVDAQLQPGGQQVTVDVVAEAGAALQTEAPVRGGNISERQVTELPVAGRNPVSLALTLPGISSNRGGFGVGTFSVNGARGRSNNFLIDGTENNDISVAGQGFQITNPDAVQEVSVQTSNFDAEFGRAGGAVVNVITRAGTNDFNGTLSYLLDSTRDDAITSQESRDPEVVRRGHPLPGTEQWFAGTFGGPIVRDRTFFFGSYQHQRQLSTGQVRLTTPSAAGRATLRQVFAPGVSRNADLLLNVTENAVADSSFFNVALGARPGCPAPCNVQLGSFFRSYPNFFRDNQFQIRVDHKLGDNDQLSARYLYDGQLFPTGSDVSFEGFDAPNINRYQNFLITETHVFSPTTTNELRLAYNRLLLDFPLNTNEVGSTLPFITIAGVSGREGGSGSILGVASNLPQGRIANNYLIQETATHVRGTHTFRFGGEFTRQISRQSAPFNSRGSLTYNASTGQSGFSNFVDDFGGGGGSATIDFGSPVYFPKLYRVGVFGQDRWQATPALTLTLGLRYEFFGTPFNTLRTPAFTGLFNIDPVTRTGPFSEPNRVEPDQNNFGPTIGFAYSPSFTEGFMGSVLGDRETVIRGGYQIGYDSFFNNIASNAASSSPNLVSTAATAAADAINPRGLPNLSQAFPATARPVNPADTQTLVASNLVNPYYQRWSLGVQRTLPYQFIVDASYVGSKGTKLYINEDYNPLVPAALRVTPANYTGQRTNRLDNLQGARTVRGNSGLSNYHSGQFLVQRRFAENLSFTGSYTWSKLIDNGSEVFATGVIAGGSSNPLIPFILGGLHNERAVSLFDRTHRAAFTYVYELPFFRDQRGFVGHLLGGFQLSGVTTFESGVPYTVTNGVDADSIGGAFPDRPDFNPAGQRGVRAVPAVASASSNPCAVAVGATYYTNPDAGGACIDPANAQFIGLLANSGRVGNLGRNTERTPGTNNWNFNVLKRTRLTENTALEFRTEFYNIFNHPQYLQGSISPFSPLGGFLQQEVFNAPAGEFINPNSSTTDGGGRVIRYQLKFVF